MPGMGPVWYEELMLCLPAVAGPLNTEGGPLNNEFELYPALSGGICGILTCLWLPIATVTSNDVLLTLNVGKGNYLLQRIHIFVDC